MPQVPGTAQDTLVEAGVEKLVGAGKEGAGVKEGEGERLEEGVGVGKLLGVRLAELPREGVCVGERDWEAVVEAVGEVYSVHSRATEPPPPAPCTAPPFDPCV